MNNGYGDLISSRRGSFAVARSEFLLQVIKLDGTESGV